MSAQAPGRGPPASPSRSSGRRSVARNYVAVSAAAFRDVMSRPNMRRAQLSSAAAWTSEWAFVTALAVYAFDQGGAQAVGIVGFVRLLPAAVSLPFLAALADRTSRQRILTLAGAVRAAATVGAAVAALADLSPVVVYALALVATVAFTAYRPAHGALVPSLCTTPAELTSANAVRTLLDGLSALAGPLAVAAILEASSAEVAFLVTAVCAGYSAFAMARVRYEAPPLPKAAPRPVLQEVREGMAAVLAHRPVALLVGLGAMQAAVRGALNVLAVVMAVELTGAGEAGVGLLWAAVGMGALIGGAATFGLVASHRLAAFFGFGIALWGIPLALAAPSSTAWLTIAIVGLVGAGNALVDVTLFTLLQRLLDDRVLGRVLGTSEMLWTVGLALGSLVAPLLVSELGARGAIMATGLSLPLLVLVSWRALRRIDADVEVRDLEIGLLHHVPMLRPLPVPAIEHLASRTERVKVAADEVIFRQGEPGDRFYVIADGEVELCVDGGEPWRLGPGGWFGEIALLRPVPRTATARAVTNVDLRTLDGDTFVPAVSGYSASSAEADAILRRRLSVAS